jgi:hypothetical protein
MSALIGARLIEAVRKEAERLKNLPDLNPQAEKIGKYGSSFKDGQRYVYSLESLDFVLTDIEYFLTEDNIDQKIKEEDEAVEKRAKESGNFYSDYIDSYKKEEEEEYIKTDGVSGSFSSYKYFKLNHWRDSKERRAGALVYVLKGYIAAFSETVEMSEETGNVFFPTLCNWSASMATYSQAGNIWRRKNKETIYNILIEYAKSQVVDGLSREEAEKYVNLRVKDEMKAFEDTISWLRAYLNEIRRK